MGNRVAWLEIYSAWFKGWNREKRIARKLGIKHAEEYFKKRAIFALTFYRKIKKGA